jgi:hypothetical protein
MKPRHKKLKLIAQLLVITAILQSCSVYESYPTSLDVAVNSTKEVKVKLNNGKTYEFIRLVKDDEDQLFGIAPINSETSISSNKKTAIEPENQYVKILLEVDKIKGIYLKSLSDEELRNYKKRIRNAAIIDLIEIGVLKLL